MHSSRLIPVEGHKDLHRDPETNAIISNNTSEYEKYIAQRNERNSMKDKVDSNAKELSELKSEIQEIKDLLLKLANK